MNGLPRIISFSGRKGSGKSLLTQFLQYKYNYKIINFADELKQLTCLLFNISSTELENSKDKLNPDIETYMQKNHEKICSIIHDETSIDIHFIQDVLCRSKINSIRSFLQIVGTDIIRSYNPDWHIDKIKNRINSHNRYCFSDTRFLNEKNFIENLNGECYFILRPNNLNVSQHLSETQLTWKEFNMNNILINNVSKEGFQENFNKILLHLESTCNRYREYNKDCFYYLPDQRIYDIYLKHGVIKKDQYTCYLTLKNCSKYDYILFTLFLKTNSLENVELDLDKEYVIDKELYCDNPFIIENLKKFL